MAYKIVTTILLVLIAVSTVSLNSADALPIDDNYVGGGGVVANNKLPVLLTTGAYSLTFDTLVSGFKQLLATLFGPIVLLTFFSIPLLGIPIIGKLLEPLFSIVQ
ncbi:uncharacterized protein LOC128965211 [Oppia nitens]|uniref:uncharacterized protein LOC128965211 n=1 Tax=Oppia nitens TaxID=1686743 RepID=UPI0023DBED34|nr:uncharacterized protein LOC128965211 [Oppia nitens]